MSDRPSPQRLEQLLEALLQEHGLITSLQAGRLVCGGATALLPDAELIARGRSWCSDQQRAGRLVPGDAPDTWSAPPRSGPQLP